MATIWPHVGYKMAPRCVAMRCLSLFVPLVCLTFAISPHPGVSRAPAPHPVMLPCLHTMRATFLFLVNCRYAHMHVSVLSRVHLQHMLWRSFLSQSDPMYSTVHTRSQPP